MSFLSHIGSTARRSFAQVRPGLALAVRAAAAYYTSGTSEQLVNAYNQVRQGDAGDLLAKQMSDDPTTQALISSAYPRRVPKPASLPPGVEDIIEDEDLGDDDEEEEE